MINPPATPAFEIGTIGLGVMGRNFVLNMADHGFAVAGYLDSHCSTWQPANLIQAQRDLFGAHTYERNDAKGSFHEEWGKASAP